MAEGVGVTAEDGDAVGTLVGCAVPFVERTGLGEVEACAVGLAGVPPTVEVDGGLTST